VSLVSSDNDEYVVGDDDDDVLKELEDEEGEDEDDEEDEKDEKDYRRNFMRTVLRKTFM
jgi:hypothetical protein